jgi:hypothetical protein
MITTFENQPANARIWIYQASRNLTAQEETWLLEQLQSQLSQWAAHGEALQASAHIEYGRFVVLALNENLNAASGCSIDASTRWLKELGTALQLDFFDRSLCYLTTTGLIENLTLSQIKEAIHNGIITDNTLIFNNLVKNKQELSSQWKQPASSSWLSKYFQKVEI